MYKQYFDAISSGFTNSPTRKFNGVPESLDVFAHTPKIDHINISDQKFVLEKVQEEKNEQTSKFQEKSLDSKDICLLVHSQKQFNVQREEDFALAQQEPMSLQEPT